MTFLDVPGARLHHRLRGSGPLLLLIGAPMGGDFFAGLAEQLATDHTVLTHDPRGIGRSVLTAPAGPDTPQLRADDVRRLIEANGGGPADVFGSSGGAVTGLALAAAHPDLVRRLVAHEPPLSELLPDAAEHRERNVELTRLSIEEGPDAAMGAFLAGTGLSAPEVAPGMREQWRSDNAYFFEKMFPGGLRYRPDAAALRATAGRVVIGVGATTGAEVLTRRTAVAAAEQLGLPLVEFPADHGGFLGDPVGFAAALRSVLSSPVADPAVASRTRA